MFLKDFKIKWENTLISYYDLDEITSFFYILIDKIHNLKRIDFILNPDFKISTQENDYWEYVLNELKTYKPIQYILGETYFYGNLFKLNSSTLIPRPETEELVELICKNTNKNRILSILDIGTGSGCIAVSLAKELSNAKVFALDISKEALEIAQENAYINQVKIEFLHQSILETTHFSQKFDIIVSNPPYVRHLEKVEILPNVLNFEPHTALFVENDDALLFYKKISELAQNYLTQNGKLFFEVNQYLGFETKKLVEDYGFKNVQLLQDLKGNNRMIFACLNHID